MSNQQFGGVWTVKKLNLLREYLATYIQDSKKGSFDCMYIDAFAGTGTIEFKPKFTDYGFFKRKRFFDGSARVALEIEPEFDQYIFIEKNKKRFEELRSLKDEFTKRGRSIRVINGDSNVHIKDICQEYDWHNNHAVLFLDPFGMQVEWKTIDAIAETRAIETWYLFPMSAVNRLLKKKGRIDESKRKRLDVLFGTTSWFEEFYKEVNYSGFFVKGQMTKKIADFKSIHDFIIRRLQTVFSEVSQDVIFSSRKHPLYLLCVASNSKCNQLRSKSNKQRVKP